MFYYLHLKPVETLVSRATYKKCFSFTNESIMINRWQTFTTLSARKSTKLFKLNRATVQ